tara:strand:+ start:49 stop:339 length:291 start_codon:yes stop_codon:yes gene_type:complete
MNDTEITIQCPTQIYNYISTQDAHHCFVELVRQASLGSHLSLYKRVEAFCNSHNDAWSHEQFNGDTLPMIDSNHKSISTLNVLIQQMKDRFPDLIG